jgi:hypothetical protein
MWSCSNCGRIFEKAKQPHSCHKIPLDQHFKYKEKAKKLFDFLIKQVNNKVGQCRIISLPCCIHLYGKYDFLAVLPKKEGLEIRFALDRNIKSPRLKQSVPMSAKVFKNCFAITSEQEIDHELINWLKESYYLKDNI